LGLIILATLAYVGKHYFICV